MPNLKIKETEGDYIMEKKLYQSRHNYHEVRFINAADLAPEQILATIRKVGGGTLLWPART